MWIQLAETYHDGATSHEHPSKNHWVQSIDIDIEHGKYPWGTQQENEQSVREPETPKIKQVCSQIADIKWNNMI